MSRSISRLLEQWPDRDFLIDGEKRLSRGACADRVAGHARLLRSKGLVPGEIAAVSLLPSTTAVLRILSILEAGLTLLPINLREPRARIREQLNELGAVLLPETIADRLPSDEEQAPFSHPGPLLIRTSGSTRTGKLVRLEFEALLHGAACAVGPLDFDPSGRWLLNLPLFHVGGLGPIWRALVAGGALVVPSDESDFSHLSLVSTQLRRILTDPDRHRYAGCRKILLGGGPAPESLLAAARQAGLPVVDSYGMTETGSLVVLDGRPTGSCELDVAADGEIQVRGPGLFAGYHDPRTGRTIRPFTEEGWFRTGDLGRYDASGRLEITGRRDNQFISGGENIQPEEIESALLSLAGIEEAVVVAVPDEEFGMRPVAFIRPLVKNPAEALAPLLPGYKIPIRCFELPENSGAGLKPSRADLTKRAIALL